MRKGFISALLAAGMLLSSAAAVNAGSADKIIKLKIGDPVMTIDGAAVNIDDEGTVPVIVNERTLVPIRAIIEAAGGIVGWDGDKQTVTLSYGGSDIVLTISSETAFLNGMEDTLDTAPAIINERTMLPIRYISENLGFLVDWDGETETVTITIAPALIEVGDIRVTENDVAALFYEVSEDNIDLLADTMKYGEYAKAHGFTLTETDIARISWNVSENSWALAAEGMSRGALYRVLEDAALASYLVSSVEPEIEEPTVDDVKDSFIGRYYRAKHILIDADGADGKTDEELAREILARAQNGEDFDALIEKYGTDPGMEYYPDGYVFPGGYMVKEFEDCVKSLKPGEFGICKSEYGWHVIERLPLTGSEDGFDEWFVSNSAEVSSTMMIEAAYDRLDALCAESGINAVINWDLIQTEE